MMRPAVPTGQAGLVERHQRNVFAFALYLSDNNRDAAYTIAADALAEALERGGGSSDRLFLMDALGAVIEGCGKREPPPGPDAVMIPGASPAELRSLETVWKALREIPAAERTLILLRDQLHLSHHDIAALIDLPESGIRIRIERARALLRGLIEEKLRHDR